MSFSPITGPLILVLQKDPFYTIELIGLPIVLYGEVDVNRRVHLHLPASAPMKKDGWRFPIRLADWMTVRPVHREQQSVTVSTLHKCHPPAQQASAESSPTEKVDLLGRVCPCERALRESSVDCNVKGNRCMGQFTPDAIPYSFVPIFTALKMHAQCFPCIPMDLDGSSSHHAVSFWCRN